MPAPAVSTTTARLYARLPGVYRDADAADPSGRYPLLRFLSGIVDQAGTVEALLDRLDTDLGDPALADPAWLGWLAQHTGAKLPLGSLVADQRVAIAIGVSGFQAGSRQALAEVAKRALTGTRSVGITPNYGGNPWTIGISTRTSETPNQAAVTQAIIDAKAKPTGYALVVTFYSASWDTIEAHYPTSDALDAVPSWDVLEQTAP